MSPELAARVAHGLSYPFDPPGESYMFRAGQAEPLTGFDPAGRVPVVASGSNGSPRRLAEKYGDGHEIPVTFGTIRELVPVYATRLTGYGSIPATLAVVAGATAGVHVTWLTQPQVEIMHGTEAVGVGYAYARLSGFNLDFGPFGAPDGACAYLALAGAFAPDGQVLPLAEVSQRDAQAHIIRVLGLDMDVETFAARHLQDIPFRQQVSEALSTYSLPIEHPGITRLL